MAKWVALIFLVALVASGWFASQEDAPGWAPALPTLVLAAGVLTGLVYAIRYGLRRRKEMAGAASRLGLRFSKNWPREKLREMRLGVLKLFVYCRPHDELPFLLRSVRAYFENVMSGSESDSELVIFDYSTSTGSGGPNQRGTFACFRTPGGALPDLEIVPRLWGEKPEWLKGMTDAPPARRAVEVEDAGFASEYQAYSASEPGAQAVLKDDVLRFFSDSGETGWRVEMNGEWMAVTRLAPSKKIGGLTEPMTPEALPRELRYSYFEHPIDPWYVPQFVETARRIHTMLQRFNEAT